LEFKRAGNALPGSFFETVCAFLNMDGGLIVLGVEDDGCISGVAPGAVGRIMADIANLSNNPQKLDPPYLLFPHEEEIGGRRVIKVQVPASSQVHRTDVFETTIPLADSELDGTPQVTPQVAGEVTGEVAGEVTGEVFRFLRVLAEGAQTRSEAQAKLGLKGQANFRDRYLVLAKTAGLIEMTIPDKPRSRLQRYRLTPHGAKLLKQHEKIR
jgi:hypothetical protein